MQYLWCAALLSKMLISWILDANYRVWKQHCMLYIHCIDHRAVSLTCSTSILRCRGSDMNLMTLSTTTKLVIVALTRNFVWFLHRYADMNLHWKSHHHGGDWSDDCQQEFTIHTLILVDCGMQFKLSKGCGGQLERQCCTCRLLPMYITPPQSFDNMLRRNIYNLHRCVAPLWFLSWQVNKL